MIIGNRGSGKSVTLEAMLIEIARESAVVLIDWPGTLADRTAGRMCRLGLEKRLIVDKAGWTDRMPQWSFLPEPIAADPLLREMEREAARENLLLGLFSRRYQKDGNLSPNTYRAAKAALAVYDGIPAAVRPPIDHMTRLFRARDPIGQWMLSETGEREAADVFLDASRLALRSPQQWDYLVGAAGRLLDVLASPAIRARSGHSLDWRDVIRSGGHYYLGMEGLPPPTATSLAILTYTPAIHAAKALAEETGKPHPLVIVLEEAGALSLVTPVITTAMQAYRKYGVSIWIASQTVEDFRDEETLESVLAMSEHHWHQMTSGVERAARDCANPTFDPNRPLHTRERHAVVGYRSEPAETIRTDAHGEVTGRSFTRVHRPILAIETQLEYDTPANHEAEYRRLLSTLKVGERVVRGLDGAVRRELVPLPDDPWGPFADEEITLDGRTQPLGRHRLDAAYHRIRTSPIYSPPTPWNPPPSPPASGRTPTPTPPTAAAPSAMRGS